MLLCSCEDFIEKLFPSDDPDPQPKDEYISFLSEDDMSYVFSSDGGNHTFIFAATGSWTAQPANSNADSWCTITPASGTPSNTASLKVTVPKNDTYSERSATIWLRCGNNTYNLQVTQKQNNALLITADRFDLPSDGGDIHLEVQANIKYEYAVIQGAEWLSETSTKALETKNLVFHAEPNGSEDPRQAVIEFTSGTFSEKVYILQAGEVPTMILSPKDIVVSDLGETICVSVDRNVPVMVNVEASASGWLRENTTKTISTDTYYFDVDPNTDVEGRTGHIYFVSPSYGFSEIVEVTQMQKDALVAARDEYQVGAEGGDIVINLGHNVDFDVDVDGSWIKFIDTRSYVTEHLLFHISENTLTDSREGTITFTSSDKKLTQVVKVIQDQMDALIVGETSREVPCTGEVFDVEVRSNIEYEVEMPSVEWIKDVTTKGLVTTVRTFEVLPNTDVEGREAVIIFKNTESGLTQELKVSQLQKDALVVADSEYNLKCEGGDIVIKVGHNIEYSIDPKASWITVVGTKAFVTDDVTFHIDENTQTFARNADIIFKSSDGSLTQTVTVRQAAAVFISVNTHEIVVPSDGGTVGFDIDANVSFSTEMPSVSWITDVTTDAMHPSVTIAPNTGYDERSAVIKVKSPLYSLEEDVRIVQLQKDALVASPSLVEVDKTAGSIELTVGHNVEFSVDISDSWLKYVETKAYVTDKVILSYDANTGTSARSATVKFTSADGKIVQTVTVNQKGPFFLGSEEIGIYDLSDETMIYTFDKYEHQTCGRTGSKYTFRILDPNALKYYEFSQIPVSPSVGNTVYMQFRQNWTSEIGASGMVTVSVARIEGNKVWLKGSSLGFVITM